MEQPTGPAETQGLAAVSQVPGQCPECASYRLDGQAPYLHEEGCPLAEAAEESIDRWIRERREQVTR